MKKRFGFLMAFVAMLLCTNLGAWAQVTVESPWVGATIENGKTYYLYNTKAQAFLKGANNWGTRASFGEDAYPYIAEGSGNVYALSSNLCFGGKYLGENLYVDSPKADFTFEEVGDGIYTFNLNGNYYAYTGANTVETVTTVTDGCYWQLLTADDIKAQMTAATADKPFAVTALIPGANFGRNNAQNSVWSGAPTIGANGDNHANFVAEKWNAGLVAITQTLTGLPNGLYELKAQAFYRGATEYDVQLVGNRSGSQIMHIDVDGGKMGGAAPNSMKEASNFFTAGYYDNNSVMFTVLDGTATIGVQKFSSVAYDWLVFDNFRLFYYGLDAALDPMLDEFDLLLDDLKALASSDAVSDLAAVAEGYQEVLDVALAVDLENVSLDELNAHLSTMSNKINEVNAINDYYTIELKPMLALCDDIVKNSTADEEAVENYAGASKNVVELLAEITSVEELQLAAEELETARQEYVVVAGPKEGYEFDYTFLVENPAFDNNNIDGWNLSAPNAWNKGFGGATYTNGEVSINKFIEAWSGSATLGAVSIDQTLAELPAGTYRISADLIATNQNDADPKGSVSGAYLFANNNTTAVATGNGQPENFSVEALVVDGQLTFGLKGVNTTANWMALDNVKLEFVSQYTIEMARGLFEEVMAEFNSLPSETALSQMVEVYKNVWSPKKIEWQATLDTLSKYTDLMELDALINDVKVLIAEIKGLCGLYTGEYTAVYDMVAAAAKNSTPLNSAVADSLAKALATYAPAQMHSVTTVQTLNNWIDSLKVAYLEYIPYAEPNEGTVFDVSFLIENPSFEADATGWTGTGSVAANSGAMAGCDGEYLCILAQQGDAVYQTVKGLPAGIYSVDVVAASDWGTEVGIWAGNAETKYRFVDVATQGYDNAVAKFEHAGGDLMIGAINLSGTAVKLDNFRIICEGDDTIVPELSPLALDPVAGTMLEALTNFTMTYESAVVANENCTETIQITNSKGRVLAEAALAQCAFEGNNVTVTLTDTLISSGVINVVVPEGMFLVASLIDDRHYESAAKKFTYQFEMEPVEVESPWAGTTVVDGLKAYLYNPAKKAFLGAANSWGTQASYVADGLLWTVAGSDDTYTLSSTVSNGGDSHYFTGAFTDGPSTNVVVREVGVDVYTLQVAGLYIGSDLSSVVTNVAELDSTCYWQFVTVEERKAMLDGASVANPADATFLVRGANFNRNDQENAAWSGSPAFGGDNHVGYAGEVFNVATVEVAQEIKNVPNGVYRVDVQGFYRMGGHGAGPATEARKNGTEVIPAYFFANDESVQVMSIIDEAGKMNEGVAFGDYGMAPNDMAQAVHAFTAGLYEHSMVLTVTDGTIKLGVVKTAGVENDWLMFDNFRLTYLGEKNDVDYLGEGMLASIAEGENYVFYTDAAGKNHFLYAAGANNWVVTNVPTTIMFSAGNTAEGAFASAASFMASNGYYMSNAANSDGTGAIKTELITGSNGSNKRTWESQVFYKNKEGKYAIRLTNSAGTSWGANCFVNVDPATLAVASGQPTLGDALYIWNIASADDPRFSTEVLSALIEQAEAIEGVYNKDVKAALEAAVAAAKEATAAEVESAQAALQEAIAAANASIADYEAILKAVADCKVVMVETANAYDDLAEVVELAEILYADATATADMLTELQEAKVAYLAANEVEGLVNGDFSDGVNGWTGDMATGSHNKWTNVNDGFVEKWTPSNSGALADLDFYQEISGLPAGTYTFMAYVVACNQAQADDYEVTGVSVYANSNAIEIHTINTDRDATNQAIGAELVMVTASIAEGETLKVGMKVEATDANWVVMDNARLFNFNIASTADPSTGIVNLEKGNAAITVYSVDGKSIKTTANGVKNLEKGLYIVNGKKMYIK